MLLYLVRHGETGCNIDKIIQGQSVVSHLNAKGRRQAELARDRIRGYGVDFVYSSPLLRAAETAEIICGPLGLDFRLDPLLSERNFGVLEGKTREEINMLFPMDRTPWRQTYITAPPGGESLRDVANRARLFTEQLRERHAPGDKIMAVTHGGALRGITLGLLGLEPEHWRQLCFDNCSITVFELGDRVVLRRLNDTAHLEAEGLSPAEDADNTPASLSSVKQ